MNETAKEFLRAQFVASYFCNIKGSPGAFVCLYCGKISHQDPKKTYAVLSFPVPPPKETVSTVENLIPRHHADDCPVAAKIKELDL